MSNGMFIPSLIAIGASAIARSGGKRDCSSGTSANFHAPLHEAMNSWHRLRQVMRWCSGWTSCGRQLPMTASKPDARRLLNGLGSAPAGLCYLGGFGPDFACGVGGPDSGLPE
jgi:hypothetical protein